MIANLLLSVFTRVSWEFGNDVVLGNVRQFLTCRPVKAHRESAKDGAPYHGNAASSTRATCSASRPVPS